jgi:membrane-associated HD superfamily phosphohydrolase
MSVIEKLKEAVKSVVEAERQDLYAEARLNDGRVVATEAEAFSAGASVRVLSEDGEAAHLEAGSYELSDGGTLNVDADSKVVEMEEEENKDEMMDDEEKDEMAAVKAALVDKFQISPEVAAEIVEVVKEAMAPTEEVEVEAEEEEPKKEEMSSHLQDLTHEMAIALEAINTRLAKLEEAPAASPDRVLPKAEFKKETNPNLKGVDRAFNIISNFS